MSQLPSSLPCLRAESRPLSNRNVRATAGIHFQSARRFPGFYARPPSRLGFGAFFRQNDAPVRKIRYPFSFFEHLSNESAKNYQNRAEGEKYLLLKHILTLPQNYRFYGRGVAKIEPWPFPSSFSLTFVHSKWVFFPRRDAHFLPGAHGFDQVFERESFF